MHTDIHTLRLGFPDTANLLPLLYAIDAGWAAPPAPWRVEPVKAAPGQLARLTLDRELDAAFLAPVTVAANGDKLTALGAWGLACEGRAETVELLAPRRLDLMDGGSVSIEPGAAGSSAEHMLRILLKPYYDITLSMKTEGEDGYEAQGARLLYGDGAARQAAAVKGEWVADDLGVAWFVLTGLPAVWEMLVVGRDLEARKPGAGAVLQELLRLSERAAREQRATILDLAMRRTGLDKAQVEGLFARQRYLLGEGEQKALGRLLDMASRAGVLAR